jgi:hypothetical protein
MRCFSGLKLAFGIKFWSPSRLPNKKVFAIQKVLRMFDTVPDYNPVEVAHEKRTKLTIDKKFKKKKKKK